MNEKPNVFICVLMPQFRQTWWRIIERKV